MQASEYLGEKPAPVSCYFGYEIDIYACPHASACHQASATAMWIFFTGTTRAYQAI